MFTGTTSKPAPQA